MYECGDGKSQEQQELQRQRLLSRLTVQFVLPLFVFGSVWDRLVKPLRTDSG